MKNLWYLITVLSFLFLVVAVRTGCAYTTAHDAKVLECVQAGQSPILCREGLK